MKCPTCKKNFTPNAHNQRFCSRKCYQKYHYMVKCGTIKPLPPLPKKIKLTPGCDELAVRRLNGESLCMWCGKEFDADNPSIRFCCETHAAKFYNRLFAHLEDWQ